MAQYYGSVSIPHATYDQFKAATLGNGYDYDGYYGNQCWDFVQELYYQYGLTLYTKPGGGGAADCWLISRNQNAQGPFILVTGKENIKKGDVIVLNRNNISTTGHIGIADEDYHGNTIKLLNQNPYLYGQWGNVHVDNWELWNFLGIFRNTKWQSTPPTPPTPAQYKKKDKFPWPIALNYWHK